jgi:hypothetical protein
MGKVLRFIPGVSIKPLAYLTEARMLRVCKFPGHAGEPARSEESKCQPGS